MHTCIYLQSLWKRNKKQSDRQLPTETRSDDQLKAFVDFQNVLGWEAAAAAAAISNTISTARKEEDKPISPRNGCKKSSQPRARSIRTSCVVASTAREREGEGREEGGSLALVRRRLVWKSVEYQYCRILKRVEYQLSYIVLSKRVL